MITLKEIVNFWEDDFGQESDTNFMIRRIFEEGFSENVTKEVAAAMKSWAIAEPGKAAAHYAQIVKKLIN